MELALRSTSVHVHNAISNIVGQILEKHPNQRFQVKDVYNLVKLEHGERYTHGQCSKGLIWQSEINSHLVKTTLGGHAGRTRVYWFHSPDS